MSHSTNMSPTNEVGKPLNNHGPVRCLYNSAIGVDVHAQLLVCCFQKHLPETNQLLSEQAQFGTSNSQIKQFVDWVSSHKPEIILMESTGVYWMSPYEALESAGFTSQQLAVVNARDIKAAYGRKSDKADARRLTEFARMNSFKRSFVPSRDIRTARLIARRLHHATQDCTRESNRMQKLLSCSGTRVSSVFSSFKGKAAQKIINSFLDDAYPEFIACVRSNCSRLRATFTDIVDAFRQLDTPTFKELLLEQRKSWRQAMERRDRLEALLRIQMKPYKKTVDQLCLIPGVKELAALKILSEIGTDLSSFRSSEAFCSWIGICCGNNESAGKAKKSGTPKENNYLRAYLTEVGQAIALVKTYTTVLRKVFQAFKERRGHNRAVVAVAHKIARIIYTMIKNSIAYIEISSPTLEKVRLKRLRASISNAKEVGISLQKLSVVKDSTGEILSDT